MTSHDAGPATRDVSVGLGLSPSGASWDRRSVLRGALALGAAGVAGTSLAACGPGADGSVELAAGTVVAATADVPLGGGAIYPGAALVITQPTAGTFKAFRTRCPHTGCPVNKVDGDTIVCPCHGSQFSITDGSVLKPPAPGPLTEKAIAVSGGQITIA